jgi:putative membrane protein
LKALPAGWGRELAKCSSGQVWSTAWRIVSNPFSAWLIHAIVLWGWHIPNLFQATIEHEWIHALQHTSFLFSALLFWWAILHGRQRHMGYGLAVLYMFTTALHSGLLGALITLARFLIYPVYSQTTASWGLTALEDQELGGLIMWVPAGLFYVVAGLALFAGWLNSSERQVSEREKERSLELHAESYLTPGK